jgi:RimJ/RimL family protein N-acetyltransferase
MPATPAPPLTWQPSSRPLARTTLAGRTVRLEPLDAARHGEQLYAASHGPAPDGTPADGSLWTYLGYGPFADMNDMRAWLDNMAASRDPLFFAVIDGATGTAAGMVSYLRHDPPNGVIEIGHIWFAPVLQRTRAASEAIFLLQEHAFDVLRVRRLEWKCNAQNAASCRAALRYGFAHEGIFRQHMVVKGRNRDTAWYALLDSDWPAVKEIFLRWLDPANFDPSGRQKMTLSALTAAWRSDPPSH